MNAIPYSEALSKVLDLAEDAPRSGEPDAVAARAILSDLLRRHGVSLDATLSYPSAAGNWDQAVWKPNPGTDPQSSVEAIRICLALAETAVTDLEDCDPEDTDHSIELADDFDKEQMSFDLVRDLLGIHGATLNC